VFVEDGRDLGAAFGAQRRSPVGGDESVGGASAAVAAGVHWVVPASNLVSNAVTGSGFGSAGVSGCVSGSVR